MATSSVQSYAELLLRSLERSGVGAGIDLEKPARTASAASPAALWARSGAMALTGTADGPPVGRPTGVAAAAAGAWKAFAAVACGVGGADGASRGAQLGAAIDAAALLGEHAAIGGLSRAGRISAGGSCRLVRCADGWLAVNLPRPEDIDSLPAWLEVHGTTADPWALVEEASASRRAAELEARAALLGMAVARVAPAPRERRATVHPRWFRVGAEGPPAAGRATSAPRVVDLTSLWAGPLCTHLLALAGAEVIKVESAHRPDGARAGPPAFFDLMNVGKRSVALDFTDARDLGRLERLVRSADIVVESSRPRALEQLGVDAARIVATEHGSTWISITGYGRDGDGCNRIGFGDDAAAAAGLATAAGSEDDPIFCADAVADPLTGIHAALAAIASWRAGGGRLIDIALRNVAAHALAAFLDAAPADACEASPPRAREPAGRAAALGDDTDRVLSELERTC